MELVSRWLKAVDVRSFGYMSFGSPFSLAVYFFHIGFCILWMFSVVGIPFGLVHFNLARMALYPFDIKIFSRSLKCNDICSLTYHLSSSNATPNEIAI